ncbi:serine hydrolase domain-containing protein [Microbulbifer hainanensis]|uniref:serine hydrolase domain-containing protein n=1 Tax=Microbulbifer hainanensis TaxID=2735675 RepID=UPI00186951AE|nr:serine hydrolase domain-containing protein [Microbulbifer hainanensis]
MKNIALLACIFSLGISGPSFGKDDSANKILKGLFDTTLQETVIKHNIPGVSLALVSPDGIIYEGTRGVRKMGKSKPILLSDPLHVGSNTKAVTAYLAAILVRQGKIDWNTNVSDVFPNIPKAEAQKYNQATLANLLSHRAWIKPMTKQEDFAGLPRALLDTHLAPTAAMQARKQFVSQMLQYEPSLPKGDKDTNYSNAGYVVAAAMLEQVAGKPWETLVQEDIFKPLDIHALIGWPAEHDRNGVYGHLLDDDNKLVADDPAALPTILAPAGDLSLSTEDNAKWLMENLKCLQGQSKILTTAACNRIEIGNPASKQLPMGWSSTVQGGLGRVSTHVSSSGTFMTYAVVYIDKQRAVAITINSANPDAALAFRDVFSAVNSQLL